LIRENVALAFSTYRTGKLIAVGVDAAGECSISNAQFDCVTGIAFDSRGLYVATLNQIWQLVDVSGVDESMDDFDCYYAPCAGRYTGDLGIRDVAVDGDGLSVFISSRFNCLATTSEQFHLKPLWMPEFINRLVGQDRCHLNGLAIVGGKPRYVTACSQTNYFNGWRKCRGDGGVVIDIETDEIVARSLLNATFTALVSRETLVVECRKRIVWVRRSSNLQIRTRRLLSRLCSRVGVLR
jgi:uncharacterized protein (TIGR03032 family)